MKVRSEKSPVTEGISSALSTIDFKDTFSTTNHQDDLEIISIKIFGTKPNWVRVLFVIRNFFARFIGLQTALPEKTEFVFKEGNHIGFFKIYQVLEDEIILGANDSHLNFRVSIYNSSEIDFNIKVTTLVKYNNRLGKAYMFIIMPFHRIVVKRMVKQAYQQQPSYSPS